MATRLLTPWRASLVAPLPGSRWCRHISGDALTVYTFRPLQKGDVFVADGSPFIHKLLAYLALTETPFSAVRAKPGKGPSPPKGKLPYACLPNGELIGDSQFIVDTLEEKKAPDERFDSWLSAEQLATSHVVRRVCEESLYWNTIIETRWRRKENQKTTGSVYLAGMIPDFAQPIAIKVAAYMVTKSYHSQGMGRHSEKDAARMGEEDLRALNALCHKDGPFFHGDRPSTIDAVVYAFIAGVKFNAECYPVDAKSAMGAIDSCQRLDAHWRHMDGLLRERFVSSVGMS